MEKKKFLSLKQQGIFKQDLFQTKQKMFGLFFMDMEC